MKCFVNILVFVVFLVSASPLFAKQQVVVKKKVIYRKVQEVSFDGDNLEGVVRNPMGAYITHKKMKKFLPLYKIKEQFQQDLLESVEYVY